MSTFSYYTPEGAIEAKRKDPCHEPYRGYLWQFDYLGNMTNGEKPSLNETNTSAKCQDVIPKALE